MAITATFGADFSRFFDEVNKAEVELQGFEKSADKVSKSLSKMVDGFSGRKILEEGAMITRLFKTTDDLAILTKRELAEVGATAAEAADKMQRLGIEVPENLKKIAATAQQANVQTNTLKSSFGQFDSLLNSLGINIGTQTKAIEEIAGAAGKSAKELGVLGTAGLAAGAVLAGWEFGRWIAGITKSDEAIGKFTASLVGLGDVAGETLNAQMDVLAKASVAAGRAITDLSEAMKINDESERRRMLTIDTSTNRMKNWHAEITAIQARGEFAQFTEDIKSQNFETAELEKRYHLSAGALGLFRRELEQTEEAARLNAEAQKKLSDQQLKDAETYAKAIDETAKIVTEFETKTHALAMKNEQEIRKERQQTLDARNAQVLAGLQQIQALEAQNTDYVKKQTLSETEYKLAKIDEWEQAQIAAFKGTEQELARFTEQVKIRANQQKEAFQEIIPIVTLIGKSAAEVEAERQKAAKESGDVVTNEYRRQQEAFMGFQGVVVAGTQTMIGATQALVTAMTMPVTNAGDWLARQQQMLQAQIDRGEFFIRGMSGAGMPTRAIGGPVQAGVSYLVGERGPELFTPASNGGITPNSAIGGPSVVQLVVDGRVLAEVVNSHNSKTMRQGRQWPSA